MLYSMAYQDPQNLAATYHSTPSSSFNWIVPILRYWQFLEFVLYFDTSYYFCLESSFFLCASGDYPLILKDSAQSERNIP